MSEAPEASVLRGRLRYLVLVRIAFATFLLAAALAVRLGWGERGGSAVHPLYAFTAAVYALSALYLALWRWLAPRTLAYLQVLGDILGVTALIYLTGGLGSIFSFLYFPVIIAASALLYQRGGWLAASASAILFGLLTDLHYLGLVSPPFAVAPVPSAAGLLYRVLTHTAAFYLVGWLSAYMAEQARTSARQLSAKSQEVARLEVFNRYVVQSMGSGLITTDTAGRLTSLNRAAEQILGVAQEGVLGSPLTSLLPEVARRASELCTPGEHPPRSDLVFHRADGRQLHLGFSVSPLLGGEGEAIGQVLIFRDLTRLRQMEDRVRQLDRLAAVGELAAGIAHEIRNPLASISGGVQMLQTEPAAPPENRRLLGIVRREVLRLNGLVEDFLLFARPGGRPRQRLDLAATVAEALEELESRHGGREGVRLEREVAPGLWLQASPEEMRQVVSNLVRNALEAMPEVFGGGGTLRVAATHTDGQVKLCVSDTGAGIAPADLSKIFSPFFSRKERGTGLGLAIVHAIVERHGGRIEVESRPGATTFTVWLPAAGAAPATAETRQAA